MIIINQRFEGAKMYIVSMGSEYFCIYARTEAEAIECLVKTLKSDWYFSDFEVELMAQSVHKTFDEYIADADLYHCPKYQVCLPKLKIQEVTI